MVGGCSPPARHSRTYRFDRREAGTTHAHIGSGWLPSDVILLPVFQIPLEELMDDLEALQLAAGDEEEEPEDEEMQD